MTTFAWACAMFGIVVGCATVGLVIYDCYLVLSDQPTISKHLADLTHDYPIIAAGIGLAVGFGSYYAEVYHDAYIADQVDQAEKRFDTWQQKMLKDANPGARSKDYHKDQDGKVVPNDGEVL